MPIENPWRHFTTEETDFVLEMDREAVRAYKDGLERRSREDRKKYTLHTDLLPTPFLGNHRAPVVILGRNPSFDPQDRGDYQAAGFRKAAVQNLTHAFSTEAGSLMPFFTVDPRFKHTASYRWWEPKLRSLIKEVRAEAVARGVFCIQAFPYHSLGGFPNDRVPQVCSQRYGEQLLRDAIERDALLVGMLAPSHWRDLVPPLYPHIIWMKNRSKHLSRKNLGEADYRRVADALSR